MVFKCMEQFNLLKSELVKMARLPYPNPNKAFKLFTDASKHSYSGILHNKDEPKEVDTVPNLVPKAYFQAYSVKCNKCGTPPRKSVMQSIGQFKSFHSFLAGTKCTIYCDHTPLASFFHYRYVQPST